MTKSKGERQPACSSKVQLHYYAQQVYFPHYAQQVGPLFFKTPRKCQCFGVCTVGSVFVEGTVPVTQDLSLVKHLTVMNKENPGIVFLKKYANDEE
ncbi:hypothetical protein KUTeg_021943 [Tegillarca granosa]|uniref:Uncharacterized protein n=1 Tax=Tegillarca granosa TaxID=220873 RepID=A0ABQ9E4S8_TEGGR|nr:hypothetical protein KUTeg_021943 [Tegillarca granosa]